MVVILYSVIANVMSLRVVVKFVTVVVAGAVTLVYNVVVVGVVVDAVIVVVFGCCVADVDSTNAVRVASVPVYVGPSDSASRLVAYMNVHRCIIMK